MKPGTITILEFLRAGFYYGPTFSIDETGHMFSLKRGKDECTYSSVFCEV